jgi:hypothetical protein
MVALYSLQVSTMACFFSTAKSWLSQQQQHVARSWQCSGIDASATWVTARWLISGGQGCFTVVQ